MLNNNLCDHNKKFSNNIPRQKLEKMSLEKMKIWHDKERMTKIHVNFSRNKVLNTIANIDLLIQWLEKLPGIMNFEKKKAESDWSMPVNELWILKSKALRPCRNGWSILMEFTFTINFETPILYRFLCQESYWLLSYN